MPLARQSHTDRSSESFAAASKRVPGLRSARATARPGTRLHTDSVTVPDSPGSRSGVCSKGSVRSEGAVSSSPHADAPNVAACRRRCSRRWSVARPARPCPWPTESPAGSSSRCRSCCGWTRPTESASCAPRSAAAPAGPVTPTRCSRRRSRACARRCRSTGSRPRRRPGGPTSPPPPPPPATQTPRPGGPPAGAKPRDRLSRVQVETLERNCREFGIPAYSIGSGRQGIVHVIGPELGVTQPGMTIVCGDSHTATHGAFGALAFGIGTSEVEHVLATQTLAQPKPRSMRIRYEGALGAGVTAKDLILGTIGQMGTGGAAGHVVEYAGPAIEALSMEGRMTVCNMTIEGGGRAGMIAPDDTTFAWVDQHGAAVDEAWRELRTDDGASFDKEVVVDAGAVSPMVSWGTNPAQVVGVAAAVPE